MNRNSSKLSAAIERCDKRLARLREGQDAIPRTTMRDHAAGRVPSLRHAVKYERVMRLPCRDWVAEIEGV